MTAGGAMKHFLVYANQYKDKDLVMSRRIADFLKLKGKSVTVKGLESGAGAPKTAGREPNTVQPAGEEKGAGFPPDADCMIVLGGDGTVLQAVRETKARQIPIIGVNLGTLGYMTEIEPSHLEESLERLLEGDYTRERRMMLGGRMQFSDGTVREGWALNDIVISRSGSLQIIRFHIYVNGQFLNRYHADGMIVTTPTGSTGYNLSAGGPLVEPGAELIMLTPICPHSLNQRSIILSPEDKIEIEIPECREGRPQTVEVNFDGSGGIPLRTGDKIRIARSEEVTEFIRLNQVSFLDVLHRKMEE